MKNIIKSIIVAHTIVVAHEVVESDFVVLFDKVRRAIEVQLMRVHLAVPGIEWPVVTALHHRREHKIALHDRASAKPVVEVDARSRTMEKDVA